MPRKIQSTVLVTTEQGRCLELEFWKVPMDCVVLKNTYAGNAGQWMFQDEYNQSDVEKYTLDADLHPKIGYNIGVSNGGYLGEYKDFKDFKKLIEWYMSDWIVEIFDYNSESKLDVLSMLINNIVLRISEYGDPTLENFEYMNKYHTRQIRYAIRPTCFEIYIKWLRTRIDYLVTEKYKLQKDQLKKLMNICLEFALKYDDCDDKGNRSLMFGESLWLAYASFFENVLFRK